MSAAPARTGRLVIGLLAGSAGGFGGWRLPHAARTDAVDITRHIAVAQQAEAAGLDAYFIADGLGFEPHQAVGRPAGGLEPITTLAALAVTTSRIGLVPTASTSFNDPFTLARALASLDHISGGRAGWNVVTSSGGHHNYGVDVLPPQEDRYRRAEEFLQVVERLWASWDADAVVFDQAGGVYADPGRIHRIDHVGEHFSVRGPLNVQRPPQGRPVIFQAGSSASGKEFGARFAEVIYTAAQFYEDAVRFAADVKGLARAAGRDPERLRILPGLSPIIGDIPQEAEELERIVLDDIDVERGITGLEAQLGGADLSGLDLDEPIPPERLPDTSTLNGRQSRPELFKQVALREGRTLRQVIQHAGRAAGHGTVTGTPVQVADHIQRWYEGRAADGIILMPAAYADSLRDFTDKVLPILQERGLFPAEPAEGTLRHRLGLDGPDVPADAEPSPGVLLPVP